MSLFLFGCCCCCVVDVVVAAMLASKYRFKWLVKDKSTANMLQRDMVDPFFFFSIFSFVRLTLFCHFFLLSPLCVHCFLSLSFTLSPSISHVLTSLSGPPFASHFLPFVLVDVVVGLVHQPRGKENESKHGNICQGNDMLLNTEKKYLHKQNNKWAIIACKSVNRVEATIKRVK